MKTERDEIAERGSVLSDILPRVSQGDRTAVAECISRYGGLVLSLAKRFSDVRTDVEDGVQDVFVALWRNAGRYDASVAREITFVAMIARRTLIDRRRKQSRRPAPGPLPESIYAATPDPSESLEQADEAARAAGALAALEGDQRRVLMLSIYQGLTYDQIARATGLPLGTVKTHARRALIRLRRELAESSPSTQPANARSDT
jgi:RNA polymerase sigma-70 factor (ECF subfamily)